MKKHQWELILNSIQRDIAVMLLYVLESKGSSPGRQGFFMAVNEIGEMAGSIGGGIMEHKFVELAKEKIKVREQGVQLRRQVHDKSARRDQSGMICSGEQTILLYEPGEDDKVHIKNILQCLTENNEGCLELSPSGISFKPENPPEHFFYKITPEGDWMYREKLGYKNHLYIIGGGHCSLALSRLMSTMDFYISVFDDRQDLLTMRQNQFAHKKIVVRNYNELNELILPGKNHYVVIMTFGYRSDDIALRALFGKELKYLGLLGSKNKVAQMLDGLRSEGISEQLISGIHTPVGINIKSETPEEIAVSIAAEIIRVKNTTVN